LNKPFFNILLRSSKKYVKRIQDPNIILDEGLKTELKADVISVLFWKIYARIVAGKDEC